MLAFPAYHSVIEMKRYLERFMMYAPGLTHLAGILHTEYNEFDSIIKPIQVWLQSLGVRFQTGTTVGDMDLVEEAGEMIVTGLVSNFITFFPTIKGNRTFFDYMEATTACSRLQRLWARPSWGVSDATQGEHAGDRPPSPTARPVGRCIGAVPRPGAPGDRANRWRQAYADRRRNVAMIQSLSQDGVVDDLGGNYGHVIVDECHHISAVQLRACREPVQGPVRDGVTGDGGSERRPPADYLHAVRPDPAPGG